MKNVILITLDTLRRSMLGCYGCGEGLTPFLDSIQDCCLRFTRAQSIAPYTQASFPGILTSSYYLDHDDHGRGKTLSPQRVIISEHLKKNGIVTAGFHSNPYLSGFFGWNRGWDIFYDSMEAQVSDETPFIRGNEINGKVDAWLGARAKTGGRFFLWVHYMDIHEPYVPALALVNKVDPSIKMTPAEMFRLFKEVILPLDASDCKTVDLLRKLYKANVIRIDDYTRELFGVFEKHAVLKDSTVIITADHGEEFGEHGGLSHDGKMISELLDVPLLIWNNDRFSAETCDKLVSNVDVSPTIANLFGVAPCEKFQGRSLLPAAEYPAKGCFGEAIGKRGRTRRPTSRSISTAKETSG